MRKISNILGRYGIDRGHFKKIDVWISYFYPAGWQVDDDAIITNIYIL